MNTPLTFSGHALATMRVAAKHSIRSLSAASGLSRTTITRLEADRMDTAAVNLKTINALAEALNIEAKSLLDI